MRTLLALVIFASSASRHQPHQPCLRCRGDRHGVQQKAEQPGFNVLGDSQKTDIPFTGVDIVATGEFMAEQPPLIENMLKAILECLAYLVAPRNQSAVVELIMKNLRIKESLTAEEGYQDTVRTLARKPYPASKGRAACSAY